MSNIEHWPQPDTLEYMGTSWVEQGEYDNLRGHRDRLWREREDARRELKGAVSRVAELEAELVKVRESRDAWRLQAQREHDAADPFGGQ